MKLMMVTNVCLKLQCFNINYGKDSGQEVGLNSNSESILKTLFWCWKGHFKVLTPTHFCVGNRFDVNQYFGLKIFENVF